MYFITALTTTIPEKKRHHSRTFGYFSDLKRAKKAVAYNECDMHEFYYDYLVIEKLQEGIHGTLRSNKKKKEWWFKWEIDAVDNGRWVKCERPAYLKIFSILADIG